MYLINLIKTFFTPDPPKPWARINACGCKVCICEDPDQCHGCGAEECELHDNMRTERDELRDKVGELEGRLLKVAEERQADHRKIFELSLRCESAEKALRRNGDLVAALEEIAADCTKHIDNDLRESFAMHILRIARAVKGRS